MTRPTRPALRRFALAAVAAVGLAVPLAIPSPAHAWWWRGGVGVGGWRGGWGPGWGWRGGCCWRPGWGWRGGVVIAPPIYAPPVYAPPPVYYAPPPAYYAAPPAYYAPPPAYYVAPSYEAPAEEAEPFSTPDGGSGVGQHPH